MLENDNLENFSIIMLSLLTQSYPISVLPLLLLIVREQKRAKKHLTNDTFSFMIASPTNSTPFMLSFAVVSLQMLSFFLVAANLIDLENEENPFDIPTNVDAWVRGAQIVALVIAVILQNDLITSFDLMKTGYDRGLAEAFQFSSLWKFVLSTTLRFIEGSAALFLVFAIAISSDDVIDLLLDFTALEFVSQFDEAFFFLSRHGFLGLSCEEMALTMTRTSFKVKRRRFDRFFKMACMVAFLVVLLGGWSSVMLQQVQGKFLCQTIMVQFGDDMPALGTFTGLYDKSTKKLPPFASEHVEYIGRDGQNSKIAYCGDIGAWTLSWKGADEEGEPDPCDWKARSASTDAFDVTETASESWYFQDEFQRQIILKPFHLSCFDCENSDEECTGRGTCSDAVCECDDGFIGLRCEFTEPCQSLQISADRRFENFPGIREWSTSFELLGDDSGPLLVYNRPVYFGRAGTNDFNVIVFTGRRWVATYLDYFNEFENVPARSVNETKNELIRYFRDGKMLFR